MRTVRPVQPGLPSRQHLTLEVFAEVAFVTLPVARRIFQACHGQPVASLPAAFLASRLANSSQPHLGWRALRQQTDEIASLLERLQHQPERYCPCLILPRMIELARQPHDTPFPLLNVAESLDLSLNTVRADLAFELRRLEQQGLKRRRRELSSALPVWQGQPVQGPPPAPTTPGPLPARVETRRERVDRTEYLPRPYGSVSEYDDLITTREWASRNGYSSTQGQRFAQQHRISGLRTLSRGGAPTAAATPRTTLFLVPRNAAVLPEPRPPQPITDLISYPAFLKREGLKATDGPYLADQYALCQLGGQTYLHARSRVTPQQRAELQRLQTRTRVMTGSSFAFMVDLCSLDSLEADLKRQLGQARQPAAREKLQRQLRHIDMTRRRAQGSNAPEIGRLYGCSRQYVQQATQTIADTLELQRAEQGNPADEPWGLTPVRPSVHLDRLTDSVERLLAQMQTDPQPATKRHQHTTARLERLAQHLDLCRNAQTETDVVRLTSLGPGYVCERTSLKQILAGIHSLLLRTETAGGQREIDTIIWTDIHRIYVKRPPSEPAPARMTGTRHEQGPAERHHPARPYTALDGTQPALPVVIAG